MSVAVTPAARTPNPALLLGGAVLLAAYYAGLLTFGSFDLLAPVSRGLTFNSMLEHMLQGRFDVDPAAVGREGFARDGRVYAYWGVFCALLRLPLLLVPDGLRLDVTTLSSLLAVCLGGLATVRALLFVRAHTPPSRAADAAFAGLLAATLAGGPQVAYLVPSLYQEVCCWAAAIAAWFVNCGVRGIVLGRFTPRLLTTMAVLAGLALLARVSTGIGLYGALVLLLLVETAAMRAGALGRRLAVPALVLAVFLALTLLVNYYRWGNPVVFQDIRYYLFNADYPGRIERYERYGFFSLGRLPMGLLYYLAPIFVLRGGDGRLLFEDVQQRLFDDVELPPASFLVNDLLLLVLASAFLAAAIRRPAPSLFPRMVPRPLAAAALAAGLLAPCLLMLTATALCYRYRFEFYPELTLLALLGVAAIGSDPARFGRRWRGLIIVATVVSIAGSHAGWALYRISGLGPATIALNGHSVLKYYYWNAAKALHPVPKAPE